MADQFTARKLWCLDQAMRDTRVTDLDFRLLYYIGHSTDRGTGEARVKQSTIAAAVNAEGRSVQRCIERLQSLGHLQVSFAAGRSKVNGYCLCLEKATLASHIINGSDEESISGVAQKATAGTHIDEGKGDPRVHKRRPQGQEKATRHSHQSIPCLIPCLIPKRASAPADAEALAALGAKLEARLGADRARSWFGKAVITDVVGDMLTLEMPTTFIAARVRSDYAQDLLACCSALVPSIKAVRMTVASSQAAAGAAA
jgi:hypothetical protein